MKRQVLFTTTACAALALTLTSWSNGPFNGGAGNRTGSVGTQANCSTGSGCHAANNSSLSVAIALLDNGVPVTKYTPGKTYRILLGGQITGNFPKFGFQASVVKASDGSTQAGTLATGGRSSIATRSSTPQIIEHSSPITGITLAGNSIDSVSFLWTAPAAGTGTVRVYAMLNAVNFNGNSSGDAPNGATAEFEQASAGVSAEKTARVAVYPNPARDFVHVKGGSVKSDITVMDAAGRRVRGVSAVYAAGEWTIAISALPAGQYIVVMDGTEGRSFGSFIK